jgi:1-acyl-sn-glycerol-3-phosphate acyltransferase
MSLAVPLTLFGLSLWTGLAALVLWCREPRFRGGDVVAGLVLRAIQVYARVLHGLRATGLEHVPRDRTPEGKGARPLLVIANHTAGVDPLLIQAAMPFEARWVMARDMRVAWLDEVWAFARVIFVDREGEGAAGLRDALAHLKAGLTLGVFPEGAIERPRGRVLPFQPGIGLLAGRSGALILPVVIEGTPHASTAWGSLIRPSRSRVRFLPVIDPKAAGVSAGDLAAHVRRVIVDATGWPAHEWPPKFEGGQWWYAREDGTYVPESPRARG